MEITVNRETRRFVSGEVTLFAEAAVPAIVGEGRGEARFNHFYLRAAEIWFSRCEAMAGELSPGRYHAALCCAVAVGENEISVRGYLRLCLRGRPLSEEMWEQRWQMPGGRLLPEKRRKMTKSKTR